MKKDIVIAGVGGQGNIFASNVLCQFAMKQGLNVQGTETIGAAQRGGSVVSHVRISDQTIYSSLVPTGSADGLLGLEALELLRNVGLLGGDGYYIMNLFFIPTAYTNLGIDRYPASQEMISALKKACRRGYEIPATVKAAELGNTQMTNVVMLGALTKVDDFFEYSTIRKLIEEFSPEKFVEKNLQGFDCGRELI